MGVEGFFVAEYVCGLGLQTFLQTGKAKNTVAQRLGTLAMKADRYGGFSALFASW